MAGEPQGFILAVVELQAELPPLTGSAMVPHAGPTVGRAVDLLTGGPCPIWGEAVDPLPAGPCPMRCVALGPPGSWAQLFRPHGSRAQLVGPRGSARPRWSFWPLGNEDERAFSLCLSSRYMKINQTGKYKTCRGTRVCQGPGRWRGLLALLAGTPCWWPRSSVGALGEHAPCPARVMAVLPPGWTCVFGGAGPLCIYTDMPAL